MNAPLPVKSEIVKTVCHGTLDELYLAISTLRCRLPLADEKHCLAIFVVNPKDVIDDSADVWEILNPMIHQAFGYGAGVEDAPVELLKTLAVGGNYGINGHSTFGVGQAWKSVEAWHGRTTIGVHERA